MYTKEDLAVFSVWLHKKTNNRYVVFGMAINSTNGVTQEGVLYQREKFTEDRTTIYYREINEFLDGRFELLRQMSEKEVVQDMKSCAKYAEELLKGKYGELN